MLFGKISIHWGRLSGGIPLFHIIFILSMAILAFISHLEFVYYIQTLIEPEISTLFFSPRSPAFFYHQGVIRSPPL